MNRQHPLNYYLFVFRHILYKSNYFNSPDYWKILNFGVELGMYNILLIFIVVCSNFQLSVLNISTSFLCNVNVY